MFLQQGILFRSYCWWILIFLGACLIGCSKQLAHAGKDSSSIKELIDQLNKGDFLTKLNAMKELKECGADAKPAVSILVKILEDDKTPIPGAAAAVEQKRIARLEDANPTLRSFAAATLAEIGPDAKLAIPVLLNGLKDKHWFIRIDSAKALADIGENGDKILSALKEALNDSNTDVRIEIAKSLAELDPTSQQAITTLTKLLKDKDPKKRYFAAYALAETRSTRITSAIPDLLIALKDSNEDVRKITAQSLGSICENSATVVPSLIERLEKDKSSIVRIQAAQALQEFGPEANAAIPALTRVMEGSFAQECRAVPRPSHSPLPETGSQLETRKNVQSYGGGF